jgi:hypothetical protein
MVAYGEVIADKNYYGLRKGKVFNYDNANSV